MWRALVESGRLGLGCLVLRADTQENPRGKNGVMTPTCSSHEGGIGPRPVGSAHKVEFSPTSPCHANSVKSSCKSPPTVEAHVMLIIWFLL